MPASRSRFAGHRARAAACLLLGALVFAGCEGRLRSNPLDPKNPETGGGPTGFAAIAGYGEVTLRWNPAAGSYQLAGFLLERRHGTNPFVPLSPILPMSASGYDDTAVTNDLDYDYRLSYVQPNGSVSGTPAEQTARPGQEIAWVADPGADEVIRMSPDGRARVLTLDNVPAVNHLSVQLSDGRVWATEPIDGRVRIWSVAGVPLSSFGGLDEPNAIAVDPGSLTAWICEETGLRARRWTQDGVEQAVVPGLTLPTDAAITPGGGAWLVDEGQGRLLRVNAAGAVLDTVDVGPDPRRLAVDTLDGSVWVSRTTAGEVVHISAAGAILSRTPGCEGAYGIDIDEFRNQVGVSRPRGLSVVDRTGECWVVAIQSHELVRIAPDGAIESRYAGFSAPFDVRVDPGPRPN
jgi:hypothetical protein